MTCVPISDVAIAVSLSGAVAPVLRTVAVTRRKPVVALSGDVQFGPDRLSAAHEPAAVDDLGVAARIDGDRQGERPLEVRDIDRAEMQFALHGLVPGDP